MYGRALTDHSVFKLNFGGLKDKLRDRGRASQREAAPWGNLIFTSKLLRGRGEVPISSSVLHFEQV